MVIVEVVYQIIYLSVIINFWRISSGVCYLYRSTCKIKAKQAILDFRIIFGGEGDIFDSQIAGAISPCREIFMDEVVISKRVRSCWMKPRNS